MDNGRPKSLYPATAIRDPKNCNNSIEVGTRLAQNGADLVQNELIELGFSASSSSSHVVVLQGHPSGVEPAGSSSSVAAPHLTT